MKIPDGLTIRITKNVRNKTTTIVAYRKGGHRRPYKAIIPMCDNKDCKQMSPHSKAVETGYGRVEFRTNISYHQRDVDALTKNLLKSYS